MTDNAHSANEIAKKYQRAQTLMQGFWDRNIAPNSTIHPIWIEGSDCFWYERQINTRKDNVNLGDEVPIWDREYRLVNAKEVSNTLAFDHITLAAALAEMVKQDINENQLPITNVEMQLNPSTESDKKSDHGQVEKIHFSAFGKTWFFKPQSGALSEVSEQKLPKDRLLSPDGKAVLFTCGYNLWLQDLTTNEERALTRDGEEDYCYTVGGNGWGYDHNTFGLQALWSKDSKRVFTLQRDSRQVLTMPVVEHIPGDGSVRPKVRHTRMAMQGDDHVPEYRLVAIDIETGRLQAANYRPLPITRNSDGFFDSNLGWWNTDNQHAYFVDMERDYQTVRVVEFNTHSGATRILFEETSATHISLMLNQDEYPTFVPLPETNELIWFSERSGWAHLYLYDLDTGSLKRPLSEGEWMVRNILFVDKTRRELLVQTMGRTPDRDPYYRDVVRVNMDTAELTEVVSSDHDYYAISAHHFEHEALTSLAMGLDISAARSASHSGNFVVVNRSRADSVSCSLLLDRDGKKILDIEAGDLFFLKAAVSDRWEWPEPVKLKAADGTTDIYGLVFRPSGFSPDQSYPVVTYTFNTPELARVAKGSFSNDPGCGRLYCEAAALAELGFIVVQIDGRGTPYRCKAFHDESYGWIESANNLDDHVVGIRQLGERYPYIDLNRVGISTLSGGTGAVQGLLHYPDFYKVGAHALLSDSRLWPAPMWSDKYEGLAGPNPKYQYPEAYADNLQGKLLIMHGMLDIVCPVAATFRMVEAFRKANKDFDLLLLPSTGHTNTGYMIRRSWDFLVKHLQGTEPPKEFKLTTAWDRRG